MAATGKNGRPRHPVWHGLLVAAVCAIAFGAGIVKAMDQNYSEAGLTDQGPVAQLGAAFLLAIPPMAQAAPPLAVRAVPRGEANPGTVGTAADWLLRFLVHPRPSVHLAAKGAVLYGEGVRQSVAVLAALGEIAVSLGLPGGWDVGGEEPGFTVFSGPAAGSQADPEHLARACWALALLTEVYRAGPKAGRPGPARAVPGSAAFRGRAAGTRSPSRTAPARGIRGRVRNRVAAKACCATGNLDARADVHRLGPDPR